MKSLIQLATLAIMTLGLSSCDPFEGVFQVKKTFVMTDTYGANYQIPVGSQNTSFEFWSGNRASMKLVIDNTAQEIMIQLPSANELPENGQFEMPASQLGQKFSIKGTTETKRIDSDLFRGYEQCNYTRYEYVCYIVNNQQVCRQEQRTIYGQQRVEYFNRRTNKKLNVNFLDTSLLATFSGTRSTSERVYTFKDYCF